jgi:hypothetical protein
MAINQDFIVKSGIQVLSTTSSTSTNTGALQVKGGAGVGGSLYVGGTIVANTINSPKITGTTATIINVQITGTNVSTSTTTGALIVTGGVGVGGSLYATALYSGGSPVLTSATIQTFGVTSLSAGTDTAISTSSGAITIWNNSTLQTVTNRGNSTNVAVSFSNATASTGSTNGAVVINNGLGVGGSVNIGSQLTVAQNYGYNTLSNTIAYFGANATTYAQINLQNIGAGASSSVDYIATANNGNDTTNFVDLGINNSSFSDGTFTIAGANSAYLYAQGGNIAIGASASSRDIIFFQGGTLAANEVGRWANASGLVIKQGTIATTTNTGALIVQGGTGIWGNLYVGGNTNLQATTATSLTLTGALTGTSADFNGLITFTNPTSSINTASTQAVLISGGLGVAQQIAAARVLTTDQSTATSAGDGSLQVGGGAYISGQNSRRRVCALLQFIVE